MASLAFCDDKYAARMTMNVRSFDGDKGDQHQTP